MVSGGLSGTIATTGATGYVPEVIAGMNGFVSGLLANEFTRNSFNSNSKQVYLAPTL